MGFPDDSSKYAQMTELSQSLNEPSRYAGIFPNGLIRRNVLRESPGIIGIMLKGNCLACIKERTFLTNGD